MIKLQDFNNWQVLSEELYRPPLHKPVESVDQFSIVAKKHTHHFTQYIQYQSIYTLARWLSSVPSLHTSLPTLYLHSDTISINICLVDCVTSCWATLCNTQTVHRTAISLYTSQHSGTVWRQPSCLFKLQLWRTHAVMECAIHFALCSTLSLLRWGSCRLVRAGQLIWCMQNIVLRGVSTSKFSIRCCSRASWSENTINWWGLTRTDQKLSRPGLV